MKYLLTALIKASLLCLLLVMASCGGDEPSQPETERIRELLTNGLWSIQSVRVDNTDQTTLYQNLSLAFSDGNFTAIAGGTVWPTSGTWSFTDDTAKTILRSDGVTITLEELTSDRLVLNLDWDVTTIGAGKSESIQGAHVFTFTK
jgi:hypothetical protein